MESDAPDDADFMDRLRTGAGDEIEAMANFVRVSSDVYPELERWYQVQADEWMRAALLEQRDEEDEEDEEEDVDDL
jgi:hypothetical protein